jgi:hypothetical protein
LKKKKQEIHNGNEDMSDFYIIPHSCLYFQKFLVMLSESGGKPHLGTLMVRMACLPLEAGGTPHLGSHCSAWLEPSKKPCYHPVGLIMGTDIAVVCLIQHLLLLQPGQGHPPNKFPKSWSMVLSLR